MGLFNRKPVTWRDDAALPHENVPVERFGQTGVTQNPYQGADDGADGNSTPNGGR